MKTLVSILMTCLATAGTEGAPVVATAVSGQRQSINPKFQKPGDSRRFAIEYTGEISGIPEGTKELRLWIPVPQTTEVQKIEQLEFAPAARVGQEAKYGNKIAYWAVQTPGAKMQVTMKFICARQELAVDVDSLPDGQDSGQNYSVYREADRLVLVDDEMRKISNEVTRGRTTTVAKARAIYDYVLEKMTYDKNHPGWGEGSTRHACDVGKGNCTDFHALFNSLCRAEGIASGFEIGLYLPYTKGATEPLGGYHCWAFFRVPGQTWVPVDCSEADRFSDRRIFFFGGLTSNRVTLSTGRDIVLEPRQAGEPLNYFLNPYAEADGEPVKTTKSWSYRDL